MNTDDKIRAILRQEADAVEPSAAGWDAIQSGIAERRSRSWWTRGAAVASAAALVVGAVVYVAAETSPRGLRELPPATSGPSITTSPTLPPSATPTAAPVADVANGGIWPLTTNGEIAAWFADKETYPALKTAGGSALAFARHYLGIPNATVTAMEGEFGENPFVVRNGTIVVATLTVKGYGGDGTAPFVVTDATTDGLTIAAPGSGAALSGTLTAQGSYEIVDPAIDVTLFADTGGSAPVQLAKVRATTGPEGWSAAVSFTTTARTGSLLVTNPSLKDGSVAAAAAIPVTFGGVAAGTPKAMVAARDGRIAVLSTTTGKVVRWLTEPMSGRGAFDPRLSDDGKTVVYAQLVGDCESEIRSVPVAGGAPKTLAKGPLHGPGVNGPAIAYVRSRCGGTGPSDEVVANSGGPDFVDKVDGVVVGSVAVGSRFAAYISRKESTTTLHTMDVWGELGDVPTSPPAGCVWDAVAWGKPGGDGREMLLAVASCSVDEQRVYRFDQDMRSRALVATLHLPSTITSFDAAGDALVLEVQDPGGGAAWAYVDGGLRRIPGIAQWPSWS